MRHIALLVMSDYYNETVVDEDGASSIVRHRESRLYHEYGGRYASQTDWLALSAEDITPTHGQAVDAVWFDIDREEHRLALNAIVADANYEIITELVEVPYAGCIPADWPT